MTHLDSKKIVKIAYKTVYIVDFTLLEETPLFSNELKAIGTWFDSTSKRWMCHTELTTEEFKDLILRHVAPEDAEKVKFYKDSLPSYGNQEIPF